MRHTSRDPCIIQYSPCPHPSLNPPSTSSSSVPATPVPRPPSPPRGAAPASASSRARSRPSARCRAIRPSAASPRAPSCAKSTRSAASWARATDLATLQFRMLNRSKGPAVWAPRAQCDRGLYRRAVRTLLEQHHALQTDPGNGRPTASSTTMAAPCRASRRSRDGVFGARASSSRPGTFLRGRIHIGTDDAISRAAGRESRRPPISPSSSSAPGSTSRASRRERRRASTAARSIQSRLERPGKRDRAVRLFVVALLANAARDAMASRVIPSSCRAGSPISSARASRSSHDNIGESAMYGGAIASRGPRYCPSVEDKIVKFPDAERHQLFLEPEGHDTRELYVNGLSTSLPATVQLEILRIDPRARERADDARRLRDRVRLLSADAARPDAAGASALRGSVLRRPDQRHDRLRRGRGAGRRRRHQCRGRRTRSRRRSCSAARLRTSACSSTTSSRAAWTSRIACSRRAPSSG